MSLSDSAQFVRVGGKTYRIEETEEGFVEPVDQLMLRMQERFDVELANVKSNLQRELVNEAFTLSHNELRALVREASRNEVAIPMSKQSLPLVALGNVLCPVRSVIYSPTKISGSLGSWLGVIPSTRTTFWTKVNELVGTNLLTPALLNARAEHKLVALGTVPFQKIALYTIKQDMVLTTSKGYHTTGTAYRSSDQDIIWYSWCTGDMPATRYWALPRNEFTDAINSINLDSIANSSVMFNGREVRLEEMIMGALGTTLKIQHVAPTQTWEAATNA